MSVQPEKETVQFKMFFSTKILSVAAIVFTIVFGKSNLSQKSIDSINNLPYELKVKNTSQSITLYLNNAISAQKVKYKKGEADSYSNLGLVYYIQGKYDQNTLYMLKAIRMYQSLGLTKELSSAYAEYGYQLKRRNISQAQRYMIIGMQLAESNKDNFRLRAIYDNYGVIKEMKHQLDSALFYYQKAMRLKQSSQDWNGIPYSANKIAMVKLMQKKSNEAKKLFDYAYTIRQRINDVYGIAESLNFYGFYYKETNQNEKAIDYFNRAVDWSKKNGFTYLTQDNYRELASIYEIGNNFQKAFECLKNHTIYKDSILNIDISSKQQELDTQYETEQKEKQILLQRIELAEKNNWIIGSFSLVLLAVLCGFLLYTKQKQKNIQLLKENQLKDALLKIETQNKLQEQRLRISRDLHDNIGSQLTFIISSLDNLKYGFQLQDEKLENKINTISGFTRDTIYELRDTIWAMNKEQVSLEDLEMRIKNYIEKAESASEQISFSFDKKDVENQLIFSSVQGMNIYRIIQEAVNNAIKYADAKQIAVKVAYETNQIVFTITDDGIGFDMEAVILGNGIQNMKKRAAEIQSQIYINSLPKYGTAVTLKVAYDIHSKSYFN